MSTGEITFYDDETACAGGQSLQAPHYDLPIAVTEAELTVYPNPAKEELTIINPVDLEETVKVILFDTFGKQVQQIQLNELSKTIDVSHLTNGMYFIQLYSKHKKYATKVIINR